jgi:hypothetical protein
MEQDKEQKETVERVMHQFKHGELKSGTGKKVTNPKQAVAIGLREAGASKYASDEENEQNLRRTKERERRGETAKDEKESARPKKSSSSRSDTSGHAEQTKGELYEKAKERNIPGRSKMSKQELQRALEK